MAKGMPGKIRNYLSLRKRAGKLYKAASALLDEIVPEMQKKRDKRIRIAPKANAVLIDAFGEKLTMFKPVGFDRFKIEVEDL